MDTDPARLKQIWNQSRIPVILRRSGKGERPRIRLPFDQNNRTWLQGGRRTQVVWNAPEKCWEIPKKWFNDFVHDALARYGQLFVVQPYQEQEKCAPACWNAAGHECQCSCMGANHGAGNDGRWFEVSDTFATRWGDRYLACRLMVRTRKTDR